MPTSGYVSPAHADPRGTVVKDFAGNSQLMIYALGSTTPNTSTLFNVANGNGIAPGAILINSSGRRYSPTTYGYLWIYTPLANGGTDAGSGSRWQNIF